MSILVAGKNVAAQLRERHLRASVVEGLLVDPPDPLQGAHLERVRLSVPQAPAPRPTAVFSLLTRTVAGTDSTPPRRSKPAVWQDSHDSMSLQRIHTTASFRLHDSTL